MWTIKASDKFGDYVIIGIMSISAKKNKATIIDFIISCRVVGRYIEESMIQFLKDYCKKNKMEKINGIYKKTEKNQLCFNFFKKLKLINNKNNSFEFSSKDKKINLLNIIVKKPF